MVFPSRYRVISHAFALRMTAPLDVDEANDKKETKYMGALMHIRESLSRIVAMLSRQKTEQVPTRGAINQGRVFRKKGASI